MTANPPDMLPRSRAATPGRNRMITRRRLLATAAVALVPHAVSAPARAQAWPGRFVRLVVPNPPGGGIDSVARIVANRLSEIWGQQVVIENKGGAGGNIALDMVAHAPPDGYSMIISSIGLAINRYLFPSLPYNPDADFAPVTLLCQYPNLMVVPNSSPAKSVQEFIAYAKANRGKVTFASSGAGTSTHLSGELFKRMSGIEMTHVPYRGATLALNDLIPGRIDMMFNTIGGLLPPVRNGQLRGLAVSTAERFPTAPEFPTVAESGLPGFDVPSWYAFFVPAKTPPDIVRRIHADTVAVLAEPAVKAKLELLGVVIVGSTPEMLAAQVKIETEKWGPIIKGAGIKGEE
jgi:tripartite-type tricarboxylate transporter receptor subunit TctC